MQARDTLLPNDVDAAFARLRELMRAGDDLGAISVASMIAENADDPRAVGKALSLQLGSMFNLGRVDECPAVLDRAFGVANSVDDHALLANLHALAGFLAAQNSFERCIRHLVQGTRVLDQVRRPTEEAVSAGHNLSVTYSYAGFHEQAMVMGERTYAWGQTLGLRPGDHALAEIAVRRALALDHRGDTAESTGRLREVLRLWSERVRPEELWPVERAYFRYAAMRLKLLGADVDVVLEPVSADALGWEADDLRLLSAACTALLAGRPADALATLDDKVVNDYTLGPGEIFRLRALAHVAAGDYQSAMAADREACRLATAVAEQLRNWLIDATGTQLDHEVLRRTVDRYASEALTDSLTGLPNRRHSDRWLAAAADRRHRAAIGIIDLDDFKTINTVHGHLGGDLVLQRVAGVLARTVRTGDFVARHGGDEFLIALPSTDQHTAHEIGARIAAAVAAEPWNALVSGTPVSVTIGWSALTEDGDVEAALDAADRAMLSAKPTGPTVIGPQRPHLDDADPTAANLTVQTRL